MPLKTQRSGAPWNGMMLLLMPENVVELIDVNLVDLSS